MQTQGDDGHIGLYYALRQWGLGRRRVRILSSVQRTDCIESASAYRTVSKSAILVIRSVIPKAEESLGDKNVNGETVNVDDARKRIIQNWQEKWITEASGRWTAKLFPDITRWMHQPCCIKHVASNILYQTCCIKHVVTNMLHQICCIKHVAPTML